ncbi:hypothetical protein LJK88_29065 [Paenibacillus sp. P26]|nr:hypothetical protein LJK88_29065 [Paenibacillus sp. P26]
MDAGTAAFISADRRILIGGDLQFVDVEPERDKPKRNKLVIGLTVLVGAASCGSGTWTNRVR